MVWFIWVQNISTITGKWQVVAALVKAKVSIDPFDSEGMRLAGFMVMIQSQQQQAKRLFINATLPFTTGRTPLAVAMMQLKEEKRNQRQEIDDLIDAQAVGRQYTRRSDYQLEEYELQLFFDLMIGVFRHCLEAGMFVVVKSDLEYWDALICESVNM